MDWDHTRSVIRNKFTGVIKGIIREILLSNAVQCKNTVIECREGDAEKETKEQETVIGTEYLNAAGLLNCFWCESYPDLIPNPILTSILTLMSSKV